MGFFHINLFSHIYSYINECVDNGIVLFEQTSKKKLGDLLNHLYSLGIIGNCGDRTRFAFRGDNKLIVDYDMKVHDALWNHFAIKYRSKR